MRRRRPDPANVRKCKLCEAPLTGKHPNARFCCSAHKDRYHNITNPRGFYQPTVDGMAVPPGYSGFTDQEEQEIMDSLEMGWDAHKDAF